jgi:hypothetical protein
MKRTTTAAAIALAVALTGGIAQAQVCTNFSLAGTFAYTTTGSITAPSALAGPFASVGTQTFDGQGGTTAKAMVSQNGNIIPVTITGTYSVNPDCTGTFTLQLSPIGLTTHVFFVIDHGETEFQAIETDAGVVVTGIARRLFP